MRRDSESTAPSPEEEASSPVARAARRGVGRGNVAILLSLLMLCATLVSGSPAMAASPPNNGGSVSGTLTALGSFTATASGTGKVVHVDITPTTTATTDVWAQVWDVTNSPKALLPSIQRIFNGVLPGGQKTPLNDLDLSGVLQGNTILHSIYGVVYSIYKAGVLLDVYVNVTTPPPINTGGGNGNGNGNGSSGSGLPIPTSTPGSIAGTSTNLTITGPGGVAQSLVQVTVTAAQITAAAQAVGAAKDNLVITVPTVAAGQVSQLPLSASVIAAATQAGKGLSLQSPQGTLTLSKAVLAAIAQQVGSGQQALISVGPSTQTVPGSQSTLSEAGAPVEISVQIQDSNTSGIVGKFEPSGSENVQLTLPFDASKVSGPDALKLGVYYYDTSSGQWVYQGGKVDLTDGTVTTGLHHLSTYAVLQDNQTFADLGQAAWAQSDLEIMIAHHIVDGVSATAFEPNAPVTRAQFTAMVDRALGLQVPAAPGASQFSDVSAGDWFAGDVQAAAKAGIVSGYPGGTFQPNAPITRAQLAVMVVNAMSAAGQPADVTAAGAVAALSPFHDAGTVASWAQTAMGVAISEQIINGVGASQLQPNGQATRAQATVMLKRLLVYLGQI